MKGLVTTLNNELCLSYAIKSIEVALYCLPPFEAPILPYFNEGLLCSQ